MLLTLLILSQATAEWVEISQQHYRKPIRTHTSFNPFTTQEIDVEDTTKPWNFNNKTVSEYNWNKTPVKLGVETVRTANVRKTVEDDEENAEIHGDVLELKPNLVIKPIGVKSAMKPLKVSTEDDMDKNSDVFELKTRGKPVEYNSKIKPKGTIERVPNIGNVKRVKLDNTPVKSPVVEVNQEQKPKTRYEELPLDNDKKDIVLVDEKPNNTNNRRIYVNNIRNKYTTEVPSTFPNEDESAFTEEEQVVKKYPKLVTNRTITNNVLTSEPSFITATEDYDQYEDKLYKGPSSSKKKIIFSTEATYIPEEITKVNIEVPKTKQTVKNTFKNNNEKVDEVIKRRPVNKLIQQEVTVSQEDINSREEQNPKKENNVKPELNETPETTTPNNKYKNPDKEKVDKKPQVKTDKTNMETLLKIMSVVADTISQNTRRSFGGKMRYLHELKNSILGNIAARIDAAWPDDDAPGSHRRSRSTQASARGHHVAFPSSESALMTISFLTFAVFLIKLVLQVIHTYKHKAMMVAPVMVAAAGRAMPIHRGKH